MTSDEDLRAQLKAAGQYLDRHSTVVDPNAAMAARSTGRPPPRRWVLVGAVAVVVVTAASALAVRWSGDNSAKPLRTSGSQAPTTTGTLDGCGPDVTMADVDGDHRLDRMSQIIESQNTNVIHVCLATGQELTGAAGNGEVLNTIDVEPDGQAEIVAGGTTISAVYSSILRVVDDHLSVVSLDGHGLDLTDGALEHSDDAADVTESAAFGCEDVHGDRRREVVQIDVKFGAAGATWTKTGYEIAGTTASQVYFGQGTAALPPDRLIYARSLTRSCFPTESGSTTTAVCGPYLEYRNRGQDEARALQDSLPPNAPPEVRAAVAHAQPTQPGGAVTTEDRENLHFWIAQQCASGYLKDVLPEATTDQAAQKLFGAVVAGDRDAAISTASADALAVFDLWGSPLEGATSLEPRGGGTYRLHLGSPTDYMECNGWDGVIRDCRLVQEGYP